MRRAARDTTMPHDAKPAADPGMEQRAMDRHLAQEQETAGASSNATRRDARRADAIGVHSVDRFVFSVPSLDDAQRFYSAFGLDARREGGRVHLHAHGHPHRWATIVESGAAKRLEYLRFGAYAEDLEVLKARIERLGLGCAPHRLADGDGGGEGAWLRSPDGVPLHLVAAPKVSPSAKCVAEAWTSVPPGQGAAPPRSRVQSVRPRGLSHILLFTPDVARMVGFCAEVLGLRLSDRSADIIAFMHAPHGSDHHLVAFAKSHGPGLHHSSWDVGSIDAVGCGAEQMRAAGFDRGWGVGRHVLGSNYFHYVRDPWGSFAEYSFDIDFVPHDLEWPAADHPPEDSLYVWGPPVPEDFIVNHETAASADR